jgi:hypothetical protein
MEAGNDSIIIMYMKSALIISLSMIRKHQIVKFIDHSKIVGSQYRTCFMSPLRHIIVESGSWIFGKFVHPCLFLVPLLRMGSATPPSPTYTFMAYTGTTLLFLVPTLRMGRATAPVPHIFSWHVLG